MFCLYCGTHLPDDAVFCNKCGKRQNVAANEPATDAAILPFPPLPEASTGDGQPPVGNVPIVQGTPSTSHSSSGQSFAHSAANAALSASPPSASLQTASSAPLAPTQDASQQADPTINLHPHDEEQTQPSHHAQPTHNRKISDGAKIAGHVSRRAVLLGLTGAAGIAVVGGGITWFARSRHLLGPTAVLTPTPTPIPLGTTLLTYRGQPKGAETVARSPAGTRIASSFDDVQVWDA